MVADPSRKGTIPLQADLLLVIGFEVTVVGLMEPDQNRHDFTEAQAAGPFALLQAIAQQLTFPLRFKGLAEVIDVTEQVF